MVMNILISGGGTGGHLVPGIAIYEQFKKENCKTLYIMSERDKQYDIISRLDKEDSYTVDIKGISRKPSLDTFRQLHSIYKAWASSFERIREFNPDAVVITGGYLSNVAALSAVVLQKPLYIAESNSAAGITNRFWAMFAKKIFTSIPDPKFIPKDKAIQTGNPLCFTQKLDRAAAKELLGLAQNDKPVIGISGGSQGAKKINDAVIQILPAIMEMGYQAVWSLGTVEFERLEDRLSDFDKYGDDVKFFRFINRMDAFWSASSAVIARAGAGTVSEALLFKVPVIFIPIHNSPDNHQYLNAEYLSKMDCAIIVQESELGSLLKSIPEVLNKNHFPDSNADPAKKIADTVIELSKPL